AAGMFLGQGILLALLHREQTGRGQWVHTSLLESMLCKLDFQAARYTMTGDVPGQEGNHHPTAVPTGAFESSDGLV
ncbi:MAG TPA: formyl-CoA transferase, partial [Chloroflexi bacterium]|nr:formyl-CoA transferase [Chloroflexota bacterium]